MPKELNRREVMIGAATVAAATLPVPVVVLPASPSAQTAVVETPAVQWLWPAETRAERIASSVRCVQGYIAEKRGIPKTDVTTEDIFDIVWRWGTSFDEVVEGQRLVEIQEADPDKYRKPWRPARPEWLEKLIWRAVINQPYGEELDATLARALGRAPTEDESEHAKWAAAWCD